jgi:hypothetical protein
MFVQLSRANSGSLAMFAAQRVNSNLWLGLQVLGDVSDDVLDWRDIVLLVVTRRVVVLVENGT